MRGCMFMYPIVIIAEACQCVKIIFIIIYILPAILPDELTIIANAGHINKNPCKHYICKGF